MTKLLEVGQEVWFVPAIGHRYSDDSGEPKALKIEAVKQKYAYANLGAWNEYRILIKGVEAPESSGLPVYQIERKELIYMGQAYFTMQQYCDRKDTIVLWEVIRRKFQYPYNTSSHGITLKKLRAIKEILDSHD